MLIFLFTVCDCRSDHLFWSSSHSYCVFPSNVFVLQCYVMSCGFLIYSVNPQMDFSFMKNYNVIIGLNKIHLGFERFGFNVTHHVSVNRLVGEQNRDALLYEHDCRTLRFQTVREKHLLPCDQKKTNILTMVTQSSGAPRCGPFCGDIRLGVQESHTVTFVGLQVGEQDFGCLSFFLSRAQCFNDFACFWCFTASPGLCSCPPPIAFSLAFSSLLDS